MSNAAGQEEVGPTTYNVLFVCTGNTCRSPMAEVLARSEVERRRWRHVDVRSAGTAARIGSPASPTAEAAAAEAGFDLSRHRARRVDSELVQWADVILTMGPSHLRAIESLGGSEKVALLGEFVADAGVDADGVPDPFGGDLETYRETLAELRRLVIGALDRLSPILQP